MNYINYLKAFREKKRLSQREFAEKIGFSMSYCSKVEIGTKLPNYAFLKRILEVFDDFDILSFFE
jgi:transcriptional regulator with XRE-family HTH domain